MPRPLKTYTGAQTRGVPPLGSPEPPPPEAGRDNPGLAHTAQPCKLPASPTEEKPGEAAKTNCLTGKVYTGDQQSPQTGPGHGGPEDQGPVAVSNDG